MIAYYTTQTFNSEDFSDIYPCYDIMLKKTPKYAAYLLHYDT